MLSEKAYRWCYDKNYNFEWKFNVILKIEISQRFGILVSKESALISLDEYFEDFSTSWCNLLWPLGLLVTLITLECGSRSLKRLQTASNIEKTLLHFCNSDFNSYLDHFQVNLKIMTFSHQRKNIHFLIFFNFEDCTTENKDSVTLRYPHRRPRWLKILEFPDMKAYPIQGKAKWWFSSLKVALARHLEGFIHRLEGFILEGFIHS